MDAGAAESTQDWLVPEAARPPTVAELERRIEVALVTARASEAAVMTVGAAAFDAAEQARRAADLAERAAHAVCPQASGSAVSDRPSLGDFDARADRLMERLRLLQRVPLAPASGTVAR